MCDDVSFAEKVAKYVILGSCFASRSAQTLENILTSLILMNDMKNSGFFQSLLWMTSLQEFDKRLLILFLQFWMALHGRPLSLKSPLKQLYCKCTFLYLNLRHALIPRLCNNGCGNVLFTCQDFNQLSDFLCYTPCLET